MQEELLHSYFVLQSITLKLSVFQTFWFSNSWFKTKQLSGRDITLPHYSDHNISCVLVSLP